MLIRQEFVIDMCEQVVAPPPKPAVSAAAVAAAAAKAKQKERARMDANVEKEVDRIIDSQDNEYVLSRPKCALFFNMQSIGCRTCVVWPPHERPSS